MSHETSSHEDPLSFDPAASPISLPAPDPGGRSAHPSRRGRGRLRALAPLPGGRGRKAAGSVPCKPHRAPGRGLLRHAPRGGGRAGQGPLRPPRRAPPARRRAAAGRRGRGRHAGELAARGLARPRGGARPRRRRGLRVARDARPRPPRDRHRRQQRRRGALRRLRAPETRRDARAARRARSRVGPAPALPPARPLGQPGPHGRARLRGLLALGLAEAARLPRPALHGLRARQRLARHQRHGDHQRERQRHQPHARVAARRPRRSPTCSGPTASGST